MSVFAPVLIFGYGNPSRGDDAIGPLFIERLSARNAPAVECLTDFQLQIEHALDLDGRELVLFVDAHVQCAPPFRFERVHPTEQVAFTTHAVSPAHLLRVYRDIRGAMPPPSFVLSVRGERFELGEPLTDNALMYLESAVAFAEKLLANRDLSAWMALTDALVAA